MSNVFGAMFRKHAMSYDLNGAKILISVNIQNYDTGDLRYYERDRVGSDGDEEKIIDAFKERVFRISIPQYGNLVK